MERVSTERPASFRTSVGELAVHEYRLRLAGREWSVLHTGEVLSFEDEQRFLRESRTRIPYGAALWPAAIALAHELAERGRTLSGRRVLELGAGTGLPGIVAASFGAVVTQTDRQELALSICRGNGERNGIRSIELRPGDWTAWEDAAVYDHIVGADILYAAAMHPHLRAIFARNLRAGGTLLLADPFRAASLPLLEAMEREGWRVRMSRWSIGEGESSRAVGVFELARDAAGAG